MSEERVFNPITAVDDQDNLVGYMDMYEAIERGYSRRVSCIFVFDNDANLLLQKRADWVNHPNVWEQSAAGHVDKGSDYKETAKQELEEELGLILPLVEVGTSLPTVGHQNGVYKAIVSRDIKIPYNKDEVGGVRWVSIPDMEKEISENPDSFSLPFRNLWQSYRDKILTT